MTVAALHSGIQIGGFELHKVIGRGGFGITYHASETKTGNIYAIKEYLPEDYAMRGKTGAVEPSFGHVATYKRGLEAFLTEANILKTLPRRKGLVRVRGAFEKFGTAYCVMEFIEGDSLDLMADRLFKRFGRIPQDLMTDLAISICWALDALHKEHLIHRDVKPANIMLRRSGEPVLIDFGAARRLSRRDQKEIIFTRSYAAIEQLPPEMSGYGRELAEGPWTDLYSMAVVLYQLVAKKLPIDAATRCKAVLSGKSDPYIPLQDQTHLLEGPDGYDPAFLRTIDEGCGLLPKQRFQTAAAFAEQMNPAAWRAIQTDHAAETFPSDDEEDWTILAESGAAESGSQRSMAWRWGIILMIGTVLSAFYLNAQGSGLN